MPQPGTVPERWQGGLCRPRPLCWALATSARERWGQGAAPATASWEGWDWSWSRGGREGTVGKMTTMAAAPAASWDQHNTVGLGTREGTLTCPVPRGLVRPRELCTRAAPGSLQPAELSSNAHTCACTRVHTCTHRDTCTHTCTHTPPALSACTRTHAPCTRRGAFAHTESQHTSTRTRAEAVHTNTRVHTRA